MARPPKATMDHVGGAYGTPWSRMVGKPIKITQRTMKQLGKVIVESVVAEARKDFAKQGKAPRRGEPVGIPDTEDFFRSFSFRIVGESTVEVLSNWPFIKQLTEGRDPYPMWWLRRPKVHTVPIVIGAGEVIFRVAPLKLSDAWIHPGFARHTFIQRGIRKGREKAAEIAAKAAMKSLKGDPLR